MDVTIIVAAIVAAIPATISAYAALRTKAQIKTNFGRNIGEHVEAQGIQLDRLLHWSRLHNEQDNDVREALGLGRVDYPLDIPDDSHGNKITE